MGITEESLFRNIKLILLVFLSAASYCNCVVETEAVSVELYYESLCPYSANFIVNYLDKLFTNGLIDIVDLRLIPYGNARIGSNDTISCQHGPYECVLNTIEACAINASPNLHFPFINCIEKFVLAHEPTAWDNLLPMFTFAMATLLRLERVNIRSLGGQAKVIGTVISVSGAMIMTLYKGPVIKVLSSGVEGHLMASNSKPKNLVLGSILVFGSIVTWSASIVFQAPFLKKYPAQLSLTAFACFFGSLQSGLIAVIWERKKANIWDIGWNFKLLGVVYSGIMCSALGMYVQAWCITKRGPLFVAIFSPLGTVITAIMELIILHVYLRLGSVVGAIVIVLGLYTALWGKANDLATEATQVVDENRIQLGAQPIEKEETIV